MDREYIRKLLVDTPLYELLAMADKVRRENVGDEVHIRALLEFSNYCDRNCSYCGLSIENTSLDRFMIDYEDIYTIAKKAKDIGYKTIVLQSGESRRVNVDKLAKIVQRISNLDMIVTLSVGELSYSEYKKLYDSGARRFLLKHECASHELYTKLHEGYNLNDRINCAKNIKEIGYEYGGGFLVGLPNEDIDLVIDNLLLLRELNCDMVGIGTFLPHNMTRLKDIPHGDYELTLKCVAITRLLLPKANIPVTTSLSFLGDNKLVYNGGANVVMVKITPQNVRDLYEIYPNKRKSNGMLEDRANICRLIESLGRVPI